MISALPDVKHLKLTPEDEFMILACDGIWNSMTSEEVIEFVRTRIQAGQDKMSKICEEVSKNVASGLEPANAVLDALSVVHKMLGREHVRRWHRMRQYDCRHCAIQAGVSHKVRQRKQRRDDLVNEGRQQAGGVAERVRGRNLRAR